MPDFRKHWTTSFFSIVRMLLSMVLAGWVSVGYGVQRKETEEVNMTIWIAQLPEDFSIESKDGGGYQASKILVDHQLKKLAKDGEKKKKEELNKEKSALEKEKESNDKMFEGREKEN